MDEVNWVTVTETNGFATAEMLAERLKSENIPAFAFQESVGASFGLSVGPLSTAYVKVPAERLEEAQMLLDVEAKPDEDEIVTCPNCESELLLDDAEWEQGWFNCPECATRVVLEDIFS